MKKTLLALLTAGTMGCASSLHYYPRILNPVELRLNEEYFLSHKYEINAKMICSRWVYAGFKKGQLQSVLQVEHCIESEESNGEYNWQRHEDNDADGLVDMFCMNKGYSYVGSKIEEQELVQCNTSADSINSQINSVFADALFWARNP